MINNNDGTYTYLVIPSKYACIYNKLLVALSAAGVSLLKDCDADCADGVKTLFNCWNMFQAACAAYTNNEIKQADLIINYINTQMKFGCEEQTDFKVPSITNFAVNVSDFSENKTVTINKASFIINNLESVKPNSLKIIFINDETVIANNCSVITPSSFADVAVNLDITKRYNWKAVITGTDDKEYESNVYSVGYGAIPDYVYYGNTDTIPDVNTIINSSKSQYYSTMNFIVNGDNKCIWFAVPADKTPASVVMSSIISDEFLSDFTITDIIIAGKNYKLYSYSPVLPLNSSVIVTMN